MLGCAACLSTHTGTGVRRLFGRAIRAVPALGVLVLSSVTVAVGAAPAEAEGVFTNLSLPKISGNAVEGEVLQEGHATWSSPPASYTYSWQRCNSAGEHCESIAKATAQTYRLTAADVGFTIRVNESAADSAGAVTPAVSEPTAVVTGSGGGGQGGQGGGSSGGQSGGNQGGGGNANTTPTPGHTNQASLRGLLARQLTPSGSADSRTALLRHGGVSLRFSLPVGGILTVRWYLLPTGTKGRVKARGRPTLVATGHATIRAGKTGTVEIRLTARGKKVLGHARNAHLKSEGTFAVKGGATVSASSSFSLHG
jgi:hypothetical protein